MTSSPGLVFARSQTSSRGAHPIPALGASYPQRGTRSSASRRGLEKSRSSGRGVPAVAVKERRTMKADG
jgi:hypothetical protein